MKLSEVQYQPWSTLVANFYICKSCSIVDTDSGRQRVASPCKNCGASSPGGSLYFGLNAYVLVNSIQDFYSLRNAQPPVTPQSITDPIYSNETDTRVVIPLLFCTLWDVLTTDLCRNVMNAKNIDEGLQTQLLSDYRFSSQKRDKLFPALTGETWKKALAGITKSEGIKYGELFKFFLEISAKRNAFVHEGYYWQFKDEELERIPEELKPTFNLFAALHNRWIVKVV